MSEPDEPSKLTNRAKWRFAGCAFGALAYLHGFLSALLSRAGEKELSGWAALVAFICVIGGGVCLSCASESYD